MGKSAGNAVWLNEERLPVYDYWQYWRNTEDADVGRFLKLFTDLPMDEIARLEALPDGPVHGDARAAVLWSQAVGDVETVDQTGDMLKQR